MCFYSLSVRYTQVLLKLNMTRIFSLIFLYWTISISIQCTFDLNILCVLIYLHRSWHKICFCLYPFIEVNFSMKPFNQVYNYIIYNQLYVTYIKCNKCVLALPLNFLQMQASSSSLMKSKTLWLFSSGEDSNSAILTSSNWSSYTYLVFYGLAKLLVVSCIHL